MQSNTFKFIIIAIGSAILTSLIFLFLSSQNPSESQKKVETDNFEPLSISTSSVTSVTNATSTQEQVVGTVVREELTNTNTPLKTPQKPKNASNITTNQTLQLPTQSVDFINATSINTESVPPYDYATMLFFAEKLNSYISDDLQASQTFTSSQKAGNSSDYKLAIKYAEDAIAIYDDLLKKNGELTIPKNMPPAVEQVMVEAKQVQRDHLYKYREPSTIHLTFMKTLDYDGLASQSEIDSYKRAQKLQQDAFNHGIQIYMPKLSQLNSTIIKYKN